MAEPEVVEAMDKVLDEARRNDGVPLGELTRRVARQLHAIFCEAFRQPLNIRLPRDDGLLPNRFSRIPCRAGVSFAVVPFPKTLLTTRVSSA